jgi:hypothetical protein
MLISKQSVLTNVWNTLDLPVTAEQIEDWRTSDKLIQHVFPELTPGERQFLMSGVTEEEWHKAFGDEDKVDPEDVRKIAMTMGKTTIIISGGQEL